jgi:hypothetical protein
VIAGFAWSDDDDDDDDDCVPLIKAVLMDFNEYLIGISGECFDNEDPPEVTLCGVELDVTYYTATEIDANFLDAPDGACVLSVCSDDDDDDCGRFWMDPVLLGPEGQLPSEAYWGVVQSVWTSDQHQNLESWIFTSPVTKALKKKDGKVTLVGFGTFSK